MHHLGLILLAGLPLWCGTFFCILNPEYTGRLIRIGPAQPLGWLITIVVIVLVGLAYAGFLSSYWFIPAEQTIIFRVIAFGLIIMTLVLPALVIVLIAPTALLMTEQFGTGSPF